MPCLHPPAIARGAAAVHDADGDGGVECGGARRWVTVALGDDAAGGAGVSDGSVGAEVLDDGAEGAEGILALKTSRMLCLVLVEFDAPLDTNAAVIWPVDPVATAVSVKTEPAPDARSSVQLGLASGMDPDLAPPFVQVAKIGLLALEDLVRRLSVKRPRRRPVFNQTACFNASPQRFFGNPDA
ncbi:hypothetical protein BDZ89DRAFT_1170277 [Hymenopellis radicata]|nr:hypothetical protein BDZ89DRAFT_1170277 [Hymenopellis radicata]